MKRVNIVFHVANGNQYKWDFGKYEVEGKLITAALDAVKDPETPFLIMESFESTEYLLDHLLQIQKGVNTYGIVAVTIPDDIDVNPDNPVIREKFQEKGSDVNFFEMIEKTYSVQLLRFRTLSDDAFDPPIPYENRADADYATLKKNLKGDVSDS